MVKNIYNQVKQSCNWGEKKNLMCEGLTFSNYILKHTNIGNRESPNVETL